jgi:hypothetical protein
MILEQFHVFCNDHSLWGDNHMIRTITMGSCVSVQGAFVRKLANGNIQVRVGERVFEGRPVGKTAA